MKILYFGVLGSELGRTEEIVIPPPEVSTVGALRAWLASRDPEEAEVFASVETIRAAVNLDFADDGCPVGPNDEVALFPPMTGG